MVPRTRMAEVVAMLKAIHVSEDRKPAIEKTELVSTKLETLKLEDPVKKLSDSTC